MENYLEVQTASLLLASFEGCQRLTLNSLPSNFKEGELFVFR
jgi:hypothetical protein